ncbi:MAG: UDP-N-acetylglucosamine 1-carboxyvinyltransferase [Deltaproteobacteria bacterium]|nr:UDP-N-acetylglucosamine 1-carboxyvinyltransferase [Deltaproteobacteria bacterium]MBW2137954.1 UDP-N-acetylglucosamine 1-carboxyvinyltransferase [Deltaproteobacteria bacterium]
MDKIVIEGGNVLQGEVRLSGAKNAALPIICACILTGGWNCLYNVPRLKDVQTIREIMSNTGVHFEEGEDGGLRINSDDISHHEAPYDLVRTMRASILLLGPLLARLGRARISLPGGCAIGARPVNFHLRALSAMGVDMQLEHGYINAKARTLKGANVFFDIPTVTGTENIMMAAVTAEGKTVIENAAREPEVQDLARMLRSMGSHIEGEGSDKIIIEGIKTLKPVAHHKIIPDRIEAGTFMIAAAMTGGHVTIQGYRQDHVTAVVEKLQEVGAEINQGKEEVSIKGPKTIHPADIKTMPFPGFPTDLQAQFMALMCIAKGTSIIRETIFENRFIHVGELKRMGADIQIDGNQALVRGREYLLAAPVMATDLRASASLIIAGLAAKGGRTEVNRIYHLDRGYERLEEKFQSLGAKIWREKA